MSLYPSGQRWYSKVQVAPGQDGRRTYQLAAGLDEAGAVQRDKLLVELAAGMRSVTTPAPLDVERTIDPLLAKLAAAEVPSEVARIEAYIRTRLLPGKRRAVAECPTLRQFGQWWTSGELARRYPEQVQPRASAHKDAQDLARHVYRPIGDVLVSVVQLDDAEKVLRSLPVGMARSTKAKILGKLHRLLDLAVYPAKLLAHNPIPENFLPKAERGTFVYLYPAEEAALLGCQAVDLRRRIAYGLGARMGFRIGEVVRLRWRDVDLERGAVRLGAHKTSRTVGARLVPLDAPSVRVLRWWQERSGGEAEDRVVGLSTWLGDKLPGDLLRAGQDRRELHEAGDGAREMTFHGLRRGFVTLSLGDGRTEDWVMRRTGHTSSAMLHRYRIAAANAAEFRLGWLRDFDLALPEMGGGVADTSPALPCPRSSENAEELAQPESRRVTRSELSDFADSQKPAEISHSQGVYAPPAGGSGQPTDRLTALLEAADAEARRLDLPQVRVRVRAALAHSRLRRVK